MTSQSAAGQRTLRDQFAGGPGPGQLLAEVKKALGTKKPLSVAGLKALREEYTRTLAPMRLLANEAVKLERQLSDLVNAAYGLTPAEIALMWQTAPPRMPLPGPIESSNA